MRSGVLVLLVLVTILKAIADPNSAENEVETELQDLLDGNTVQSVFNWKKKPGSKKKPGKCKKCKKCCKKCKKCPKKDKSHGLVVTGGDDRQLLASSELISHLGVCGSPNIPDLIKATAAGKSVWFEDSLMFCGGSNIYVGGEWNSAGWGAIDTCLKAKPGDNEWKSDLQYNMNAKRSWFSLNDNGKDVVAAGGLNSDGSIWDTLEQYSEGTWKIMDIKLDNPTYGHCGVRYTSGGNSYLMIIGGSNTVSEWWRATTSVTQINLSTDEKIPVDSGPLPGLWAPACTIHGKDIYVTGGAIDDNNAGVATTGVYKYNLDDGKFTSEGHLNIQRWGHTLGVTATDQLVVVGGYDSLNDKLLTSIEVSEDGGLTWNEWKTGLSQKAQYGAMAPVPTENLECQ